MYLKLKSNCETIKHFLFSIRLLIKKVAVWILTIEVKRLLSSLTSEPYFLEILVCREINNLEGDVIIKMVQQARSLSDEVQNCHTLKQTTAIVNFWKLSTTEPLCCTIKQRPPFCLTASLCCQLHSTFTKAVGWYHIMTSSHWGNELLTWILAHAKANLHLEVEHWYCLACLCGAIEERMSLFLPGWLRMGWMVSVISQGTIPWNTPPLL